MSLDLRDFWHCAVRRAKPKLDHEIQEQEVNVLGLVLIYASLWKRFKLRPKDHFKPLRVHVYEMIYCPNETNNIIIFIYIYIFCLIFRTNLFSPSLRRCAYYTHNDEALCRSRGEAVGYFKCDRERKRVAEIELDRERGEERRRVYRKECTSKRRNERDGEWDHASTRHDIMF